MSPRRNWDSSTSLSPASVPLPPEPKGEGTLACGNPNSDDWRKNLVLCLLCDPTTLGLPALHVFAYDLSPCVFRVTACALLPMRAVQSAWWQARNHSQFLPYVIHTPHTFRPCFLCPCPCLLTLKMAFVSIFESLFPHSYTLPFDLLVLYVLVLVLV
jgi:hypothetical protein